MAGQVGDRGRQENRFELLEQLGKGSYGSVFKGRDRENGQLYAIKVMALAEEVSLSENDDVLFVRLTNRFMSLALMPPGFAGERVQRSSPRNRHAATVQSPERGQVL